MNAGTANAGPEIFGPYRLDALIGRGGMGEVFRAFDTRRNRVVALKRLPRHLAADHEYRVRFRRESALAAKLREPHIIPIHDYGEIDGLLFIDMRLVQGVDLAATIRRGPLSPTRAVDVISQVADALDAAHAEDLVHRDVKPSNVLLVGSAELATERGFAYLADFGIASALGGSTFSRPGLAVGTANYMSPERMLGDTWDRRADVYSLACVLFECLVGRRPFSASDLLGLLQAHVKHPPPRPSELRPGVPAGLDDVVLRGMAKKLDDRWPTAGELAAAARAAIEGMTAASHTGAGPQPGAVETEAAGLPVVPASGPDVTEAAEAGSTRTSGPRPTAGPPPRRADVPGLAHPVADHPPRPTPTPRAPVAPRRPAGPPQRREVPGAADATRRIPPRESATEVVRARPVEPTPATAFIAVTPPRPAEPASGRGGRVRWIAAIAAFGLLLTAAAILVPRFLLSGPAAFTREATIAVGLEPTDVAISPDGTRAYVTDRSDDAVTVVDTATATAVGAPIPVEDEPSGIAISPDGTRLYVTNTRSGSVSVIDTATAAVVASVKVGRFPGGIAVRRDGTAVYVANAADNAVVVIDPVRNAVVGPPIAVGKDPFDLAVSPDGGTLYVSDFGSDEVTVVDTARAVARSAVPVGDGPLGIAVSPDGATVYVVNQSAGTLAVIDTASGTANKNALPVGGRPTGIALSGNGRTLYVTESAADSVSAVDLVALARSEPFTAGRSPVAAAVNPTNGQVYVVGQDSNDLSVLRPVVG